MEINEEIAKLLDIQNMSVVNINTRCDSLKREVETLKVAILKLQKLVFNLTLAKVTEIDEKIASLVKEEGKH